MNKVLKNIISAVLFIAILASLLMGFSFIMKPGKSANVNALEDPLTNGILSEKKNTIDVIFLGDSECYSTFIPLSRSSFSTSSLFSTLNTTNALPSSVDVNA